MILKSITLDNIRSYVNETVDFPTGSLLLSGDIGSGKSTILLAIEFALFGILRPALSGESLLRNGQKQGSVELKFAVANKEVAIKRVLKRSADAVKQDSGYILVDGIKTDATAVELKTKVLDLLGYPRELITKSKSLIYRYTVYTPQEEMKHILFDEKEHRLDTLRRVFGIDKYRRVSEAASVVLRSLKERAKEKEGIISDLEEKRRQLEQSSAELRNTEQKLLSARPRVAVMQSAVRDISLLLRKAEERVGMFSALNSELGVSTARLQEKMGLAERNEGEMKNELRIIADVEAKIRKFDIPAGLSVQELERQIRDSDIAVRSILQQKSEISERVKFGSKRKDEMRKEIEEKTESAKNLREKQAELLSLQEKRRYRETVMENRKKTEDAAMKLELAMREHEVNRTASESMKSQISLIDSCPLCLQDVTDDHKRAIIRAESEKAEIALAHIRNLSALKKEKQELLAGFDKELDLLAQFEKQESALQKEVAGLEHMSRDIVERQKQYSELDLKLIPDMLLLEKLDAQDLSMSIREIDAKKEMMRRCHEKAFLESSLEERRRRIDGIGRLQVELKKAIGAIQASIIGLQAKAQEMKGIDREFSDLKKRHDAALAEEKKVELEEAQLGKEAEGMQRIVTSLAAEVERKKGVKQEIERLRQYQDWLDKQLLNIVALMEKQVLSTVHGEFSAFFRKWADILVDDEAFTLRLDHEFTPLAEQNGYDVDLMHLSGGEKTAVALAYRLALNKVINDVVGTIKTKDLIILDEPTDGFSSEQLDKVREVIDELGIGQVIIVSHENKVESFVQNVIRVQKSGHESVVLR